MNKLDLVPGGIPFEIEDFQFEQSAVREAFTGILKAIGADEDVVILSGCGDGGFVISGGTTYQKVLDGFIAINGEVYKHVQSNYPIATVLYWDVLETVDSGGNETTDLTSILVYPWKIRRAALFAAGSLPTGKVEWATEKQVKDTFKAQLLKGDEVWQNATIEPNWANGSFSSVFRKTWDNYLECNFNCKKTSSGLNVAFNLPSGHVPNFPFDFSVGGSGLTPIEMRIDTSTGAVTVLNGTPTIGSAYQGYFKIPLNI